METAKHIIIVFALILFVTVAAISEESQISNTRQASCIVKIIGNDDILSPGNIDGIVHSPMVLGKAVNEILESSTDKVNVLNNFRVTARRTGEEFTFSFELNIELPENVKPVAKEFLKALLENLQTSLNELYMTYSTDMVAQLTNAQRQYKDAESQLDDALKSLESKQSQKFVITYSDLSEADKKVYEQLEKTVNLSNLSPDMTFAQVLEVMAHSVEPALQIQPNWRDLADNADILPTTTAEMVPLKSIKIGKAMDILMPHISNELANIDYVVQGGILIIASEDALPSNLVTLVYDVSDLISPSQSISSIKSSIEKTVEPDSWYDMDDIGEGKIDIIIGNQLSIYQTPEIQQRIQKFLDSIPIEISVEPVMNISIESLNNEKQDLTSQKRLLEMEVARLEARQAAAEQIIATLRNRMQTEASLTILKKMRASLLAELEELRNTKTEQHPEVVAVKKQIDEIKQKIASAGEDTITAELERLVASQTQHLDTLKKQWEALVSRGMAPNEPSDEILEAEEKLARTKIELAKRREELAKPLGVEQLSTLNNNLSMAMLDLAEKKAELQVVEKQLSDIESQIKAASTTDPIVLKVRQARKALEEAEKRVNELKAKEANLQPPQVIAIGIE